MRLSPQNPEMADIATMQPQGDFENIIKETPLPERMPGEGYIGNTSDGKSWGKEGVITPVDVLEIDKEMKKLNIQQRISAENAVLGISAGAISIYNQYQKLLSSTVNNNKLYPDLPEDDEKLRKGFRELDKQLRIIGREKKNPDYAAYKLAREQNPKYIDNYLFRIDFLRAEHYNARKAALRILRYLTEKLELFGRDKLTRIIYWNDLGDEVVAYFRRGALQLLPESDLHGRRVLFIQSALKDSSDHEIMIARKAYFYFFNTLTEHDTEKGRLLGVVGVLWKIHSPKFVEAKAQEAVRKVWQCSPTKASAYHVCHRWPPVNPAEVKVFAFRFISWFRNDGKLQLLRAHHGKAKKCTKVLVEEFGFPHDSLSKLTEDVSYENFVEQWIAERQNIDSQMELLVESIKSMGSSTMSPKEFSAITNDTMVKQGQCMNMSINVQSANQRVLNELTSSSKASMVESDLSLGASMEASDLLRIARLSSGSLGNSFSSLPWMKDAAEPMSLDDSIEDIVTEALQESITHNENGNSRSDFGGNSRTGFNFFQPLDWIGGKVRDPIEKEFDSQGLIHEDRIEDRDIKLGRGKPLQRHPGNIWFRNLIKAKFAEYDKAEKAKQTQISLQMVQLVMNDGRRFLVSQPKQKGYWKEISVAEAREKVAINFRTERKRRRKHQLPWNG